MLSLLIKHAADSTAPQASRVCSFPITDWLSLQKLQEVSVALTDATAQRSLASGLVGHRWRAGEGTGTYG